MGDYMREWRKDGCGYSYFEALLVYLFIFFVGGVLVANIWGLILHIYIERPGIEARKVFKN